MLKETGEPKFTFKTLLQVKPAVLELLSGHSIIWQILAKMQKAAN